MKHLTVLFFLVLSSSAFATVDTDRAESIIMRQASTSTVTTSQTEGTGTVQTTLNTSNSTRIHPRGGRAGL